LISTAESGARKGKGPPGANQLPHARVVALRLGHWSNTMPLKRIIEKARQDERE